LAWLRTDEPHLWLCRRAYPSDTPNPPSVVIITMPKSGSIYLMRSIQRVLKVSRIRFGGYGFTEPVVQSRALKRMQLGFFVGQEHLPASDHVIAALRLVVPAVNVHLRDPRRALVSWIGHLQDQLDSGQAAEALAFSERVLPDGYAAWSFNQRLEWHIDHVLPRLVAWIEGWLRVVDDPKQELKVVLSTFEELERDPAACIQRILERLDIPLHRISPERLPKLDRRHNVRGDPTVDRKASYTPELWERATALVPAELRARFDWA
jgi:LPS sulfotransferase NodH